MTTPVGATSQVQSEVIKYLDSHHVNEQLNIVINKLVKSQSVDPFGFLAKEFATKSKAPVITKIVGREILDSRGNPTVECDIFASVLGVDKLVARSGAPSGASTGSNEAHELRDGDDKRYLGKGTLKAAANISGPLNTALHGLSLTNLRAIDEAIIKIDGTPLKTNLGGNAATAISFAASDAGAFASEKELFLYLSDQYHGASAPAALKYHLPRPMVNILNGGKHAGGELQIQEFMIVPKLHSFKEMLRYSAEVYHHLGKLLVKKKGASAKNLGDEGGYAPALSSPSEALTLIEEAIGLAGYKVGEDIFLALDAASSEFYNKDAEHPNQYEVEKGKFLTSEQMIQYWKDLITAHPALISIEDGFDEKDYEGWTKFSATFASEHPNIMIVGDDLYTTNPTLIKQGLEHKWAKDLLLKVNQIGTISEAMDAAKMIFGSGGNVIVSHRSGETPSSIISDLAVAIGARFIKTGATARGERIAKYNRLLAIEEYLTAHNIAAALQ